MPDLPNDIPQVIREAYWLEVMHLSKLGFVEITPDGKGVAITELGKTYLNLSEQVKQTEV